MKRKLIYIALLLLGINTNAQYTYIPDSSFESELVYAGYDNAVDGHVLTANIEGVTELFINHCFINDLTGIEDFAALEHLNVDDNNLTGINLTQNTNLISFSGDSNYFVNLDFSGNPNLEFISSETNYDIHGETDEEEFTLRNVDVSQCYSLETLNLWNNAYTNNIDVTNSPNLTYLNTKGSQNITYLDLSNNPLLEFLSVSDAQLTSLDLSNNTLLTELNFSNTPIESIDLSYNTNLEILYCNVVNNLTELDLTNNSNLVYLHIGYDGDPDDPSVGLTELDLTHCVALETLYVVYSNIQGIDLNNCPNLKEFYIDQMMNLSSFSVRNGHNEEVEWTHLYHLGDNPLYCVEIDDPVAATNHTYPYQYHWNWVANPQYTYTEDCSAGISEEDTSNWVAVFPNPMTTSLNIENKSIYQIEQISITNQLGQEIKHFTATNTADISDLDTGIYYVTITNSKGYITTKKMAKE